MAIIGNYKDPGKVLTDSPDKTNIKDFILDQVLQAQSDWFSGRTLFGRGYVWDGKPIEKLYERRYKFYKNKFSDEKVIISKARRQAGIDLGYILLRVLIDSKDTFERRRGRTWEYRRIK